MEENKKISFVIVNYKSRNCLEKCIASIFKSAKNIRKEIIVVNIDDSLRLSDDIKLLEISENKGFGNACNIGSKEASGDVLCFLNPDTEILGDIQDLIRYFNTDKKIGVIGTRLIGENGKTQEWCAGKEINLSDVIGNNLGRKKSKKIWESEKPIECFWTSGACMFIKKELFEKLDAFDENFFMYFEDVDLCKRARGSGYKVLYFPELTVKHFGGKSFENKKDQKKHYYSSQDYYFKKHFGKINYLLIKIMRGLVL